MQERQRDDFLNKRVDDILDKIKSWPPFLEELITATIQGYGNIKDSLDDMYVAEGLKIKSENEDLGDEEIAKKAEKAVEDEVNKQWKLITDNLEKEDLDDLSVIKKAMKDLGIPVTKENNEDYFVKQLFVYNQLLKILPPRDVYKLEKANPELMAKIQEKQNEVFLAFQKNVNINGGDLVKANQAIQEIFSSLGNPADDLKKIEENLKALGLEAEKELAKQIFAKNQFNHFLTMLPKETRDKFQDKGISEAVIQLISKKMGEDGEELSNVNEFMDGLIQKIKKSPSAGDVMTAFKDEGVIIDIELAQDLFARNKFEDLLNKSNGRKELTALLKSSEKEVLEKIAKQASKDIDAIFNALKDSRKSESELKEGMKKIGLPPDQSNVLLNENKGNVAEKGAKRQVSRIIKETKNSTSSRLHALLEIHQKDIVEAFKGKDKEQVNRLKEAVEGATSLKNLKVALKALNIDKKIDKDGLKALLGENRYRKVINNSDLGELKGHLKDQKNIEALKDYLATLKNSKELNSFITNLKLSTNEGALKEILRDHASFDDKTAQEIANKMVVENRQRLTKLENDYSADLNQIDRLNSAVRNARYVVDPAVIPKMKDETVKLKSKLETYKTLFEDKMSILKESDPAYNKYKQKIEKIEACQRQLQQIETAIGKIQPLRPTDSKKVFDDLEPDKVEDKIKELVGNAKKIGSAELTTENILPIKGADKVNMTYNKFGNGPDQQIVIGLQSKKNDTVTTSFQFFGKPFPDMQSKRFFRPSPIPSDQVLEWAQFNILRHIQQCDPKDRNAPIYITGYFPDNSSVMAAIMVCKKHGIPYVNQTQNAKVEVSDAQMEKFEKRIKENPTLSKGMKNLDQAIIDAKPGPAFRTCPT